MDATLAIACCNISKHYPHFSLQDINLRVEQGTVMGLVGPNGAGKSTILRMVMGLLGPDSGTVEVLGHRMPDEQVAAKRDIGFVAEDMRLYESQTIDFHMGFVKSIFKDWDEAYAQSLLRKFDLKKEHRIRGLSHGQRVKTTLLLALSRRPKLLVLDEPTTGLDPAVRKEVIDEMMNAIQEEEHSILFSSHNTLDVEQISDYITFIYAGRIVDSCDKEQFMEGWRRIRLTNLEDKPLPDLPNIKDVQHNGRLWSVTVDKYEEAMAEYLQHSGMRVDAVERLTLEEIFLGNVRHAKAALERETEQ